MRNLKKSFVIFLYVQYQCNICASSYHLGWEGAYRKSVTYLQIGDNKKHVQLGKESQNWDIGFIIIDIQTLGNWHSSLDLSLFSMVLL